MRLKQSVPRARCDSTSTGFVTARLLRESGTPLSQCLPRIALTIRTRLPSLFEDFMRMKWKAPFQIVHRLVPGVNRADLRAVGNSGEGASITDVEGTTEAIARSFVTSGQDYAPTRCIHSPTRLLTERRLPHRLRDGIGCRLPFLLGYVHAGDLARANLGNRGCDDRHEHQDPGHDQETRPSG